VCRVRDDDMLRRSARSIAAHKIATNRRLSLTSARDARPSRNAARSSPKSFVLSRWRGQVPLETVFWRDMLGVGTALNLMAAASAMLLFMAGKPTAICLLVFFSAVPWNLFLFLSVWRSAENTKGPGALVAKIGSVLWFVLMFAL